MRDDMRRIMKLVEEGKLSADDAMDLIEAIESGEGKVAEPQQFAGDTPPTPPPPPGGGVAAKDPIAAVLEAIEKMTKEITSNVNWKEVSEQVRTGAKKGFEAVKDAAEKIADGKINLSFLGNAETRTIELPLSFEARKTLRVDNPCGDVRIVGGAPLGKVVAVATVHGLNQQDAKERADKYQLMVEESEQFVDIKQPDLSGLEVSLTIHLSESSPIEVKSAKGDIKVEAVTSGVRVTGASGDVRLSKVDGVIEVNTASGDIHLSEINSASLVAENKSGDIHLENVDGNLNIRTASGDIHALCSGRTVAVEAVSGDVDIELTKPFEGTMNVRTVQGDTNIRLAEGGSARVTVATLNGEVSCSLELNERHNQDKRITGVLGDGTGTIDVSAVSGNVHVSAKTVAPV